MPEIKAAQMALVAIFGVMVSERVIRKMKAATGKPVDVEAVKKWLLDNTGIGGRTI